MLTSDLVLDPLECLGNSLTIVCQRSEELEYSPFLPGLVAHEVQFLEVENVQNPKLQNPEP